MKKSGFQQLKEMFDNVDLNNKDDLDEEYNENEGENYVIRGKKDKVNKNLKNFDKIQKDLKKYEGKTTSYKKIQKHNFEEEENENFENEEEENENFENEEEEENIKNKEEINSNEEKEKSEEEEYDNDIKNLLKREKMDKEDEEYLKKITQYTPSEIKKGKNVENQKNLYDFFLGLRISMQTLLTSINSLPPYQTFNLFLNSADDVAKNQYSKINYEILELIIKMINLHKKILKKSNLSSNENFNVIDNCNLIINNLEEKNEIDNNNIKDILSFHEKISLINEKIINIWYRKTLVNTFKANNKILKVLNDDFSKHIISNIKNNYENIRKNTEKINNEKLLGRKRISEEEYDYDKEIYNDVDFYNFLLKEFLLNNEKDIENDKLDGENRYDLTMKYILNKKAKVKKNVDTKASKNRKIRYDKHEKIINFMVPQINTKESIGRDIIVNSLFGMHKKIKNNNNDEGKDKYVNDIDII